MTHLISLQEIIEIYAWIAASFLMFFITAIAIFYEKKFGVKTFYYLYFVPIIVLFAAAAELYPYNRILHESIEFLGSFGSFIASFYLYRKMVGVK